jgi:hypothetical protein
MGLVGDFGDEWEIVPPESSGLFPDVPVSVQTYDGNSVPLPGLGLIAPNAGLDHPVADRVQWFRHIVFSY